MLKHHEANNAITDLNLSGNKIGDAGAIAMADGLRARHVMCISSTHTCFCGRGQRLARDTLLLWYANICEKMCASRSVCFEVRLLFESCVTCGCHASINAQFDMELINVWRVQHQLSLNFRLRVARPIKF